MQDTKPAATLDANLEATLQIRELVGQTKAFTRAAGRCSAAKAQALATIHENKQYRIFGIDWERSAPKRSAWTAGWRTNTFET